MSAPTVDAFTAAIYDRLPDIDRRLDIGQDYALLRYLSLIGDQMAPARAFVEGAFDGTLLDPGSVEARFVPWLAFLMGLPTTSTRADLAIAGEIHMHGTPSRIAASVAKQLPGGVSVDVSGHWRGNPWIIVADTDEALTPLTGTPITTWAEIERTFPTFADAQAEVDTFADLGAIDRIHLDLAAAAEPERPAGTRIYHLWSA